MVMTILILTIYTIILLKSVCLSILARSSREMSLTVRIVWQYILSRVRISVRPRICFIRENHSKPRGNRAASASVYFNGQRPAIVASGAGRHGWVPETHRIAITWTTVTAVCVFGCVHAFARVRGCMRACVMCLQYTIIIFDPGW